MKISFLKESLRSTLWGLMRISPVRRLLQAVYTEFELFAKYRIEDTLARRTDRALSIGPFRGLRYPDVRPHGYMILAGKYFGTFEMELHEHIEAACNRGYTDVLNIGSADGYYTVGFAMRIPGAKVVAWEMESWWRNVTRRVAELNGVLPRIELRGLCTPDELRSIRSSGRTLVFSDCEGAEFDLLTHENLSGLGVYDIIVECHDLFVPNVTRTLIERFERTHEITRVEAVGRLLDDIDQNVIPILPGRKIDLIRSFEEPRLYQMCWLVIIARGA